MNETAISLSKEGSATLQKKIDTILSSCFKHYVEKQRIAFSNGSFSIYEGYITVIENQQVKDLLITLKALCIANKPLPSLKITSGIKFRVVSSGERFSFYEFENRDLNQYEDFNEKLFNRSGSGQEMFEDGSHYKGQYLNDCLHGQGVAITADSRRYEGMFDGNKLVQDNLRRIIWFYLDEYKGGGFHKCSKQYLGNLEKYKIVGPGIEITSQLEFQEYCPEQQAKGERQYRCLDFDNNIVQVIDSHGIQSDQPVLVRQFQNNKLVFGIMAKSYRSIFKETNFTGRIMYGDKTIYTGQIRDFNIKHGLGRFEMIDFTYEGEFKDDKMEGRGKLFHRTSEVGSEGVFESNKLVKPMCIDKHVIEQVTNIIKHFREEQQFIKQNIEQQAMSVKNLNNQRLGKFEDVTIEVEDFYVHTIDAIYSGKFVQGSLSGRGQLKYLHHDKYQLYEGELLDNKFHGEGLLYLFDGEVQCGNFVNGVFLKE